MVKAIRLYDYLMKLLMPMTFHELVTSFNQHNTSWEELPEIRCESCFASFSMN